MAVTGGPTVDWSSEVGAADWIVQRLHPFAAGVGSLVPEGFEAYARLLHPTWRLEQGRRRKVRWAEVARAAGAAVGPATGFEDLAPGPELEPPRIGTLEPDELDALVELLAPHTGSPGSCWFGLWEGYGWMQGSPAVGWLTLDRPRRRFRRPRPPAIEPVAPPGPRVQVPGRSLVLYRGAIGAATAFRHFPYEQSPNLWWPDDRAWCVASEIDLASTYLGGTRTLVERVLHDTRLEAVPVGVTDPLRD